MEGILINKYNSFLLLIWVTCLILKYKSMAPEETLVPQRNCWLVQPCHDKDCDKRPVFIKRLLYLQIWFVHFFFVHAIHYKVGHLLIYFIHISYIIYCILGNPVMTTTFSMLFELKWFSLLFLVIMLSLF